MQNIQAKRKLSEILDVIGQDDALADRIDAASEEMHHSKMHESPFNFTMTRPRTYCYRKR